jgi:predicted permease
LAEALLRQLGLAAPLFLLIALGYALVRLAGWPRSVASGMNTFVFSVALPALLFKLMSGLSELPPVDTRLLAAFFGGCLIMFAIGRVIAGRMLKLDGAAGSILAMAGVFSNNVLLGIPLARATLGAAALPAVALVLVFNALILWTLLSISIEWSRHGAANLKGLLATARAVLRNPIVMSIVSGALFGLAGLRLPTLLATTLAQVAEPAAPLSLIVLGMGLAEYAVEADATQIVTICLVKLAAQPACVWAIAHLMGLPRLEMQVVVLLASLPVGANVYLMAAQYQRLEGTIAASLVASTALSALTTPLLLVLTSQL